MRRAMMKSQRTCAITPGDRWLLEEDWRRFFMGYLAGPVPQTEIVKFKGRDNVEHKAGIYYFVLFRLAFKAAIDSEEIVAIVSDSNGNIDQGLSERFLDV